MLANFLKDKDPGLRLYAAELLGHIGDKRLRRNYVQLEKMTEIVGLGKMLKGV